MHIIKRKAELATTRIKRLLEIVCSYSLNCARAQWISQHVDAGQLNVQPSSNQSH